MMKKTPIFVASAFIIHGLVNLERLIFINEIFTAIGCVFLAIIITDRDFIYKKILVYIFMLITYGFVLFLVGSYSNTDATIYQKIRTAPILYSTLCFFVGYTLIYSFITNKSYSTLLRIIKIPAIIVGIFFGGKLSPPSTISIIFSDAKSRLSFYVIIISFIFTMEIVKGWIFNDPGGTATVSIMIAFCISMFFFKGIIFNIILKFNALFSALIVILLAAACKVVAYIYNDFFTYGFSYFGDDADVNALWRLMFWAKTINEMSAFNWIFGIGLGTPIFNESDPASAFIIASEPDALDRPYTLGLHNSLLTYFVRFGSIGIFLLLNVILTITKSLIVYGDSKSEKLFVSFILILISALFNVVMESPLYSGYFWGVLGICARHAEKSRLNFIMPKNN